MNPHVEMLGKNLAYVTEKCNTARGEAALMAPSHFSDTDDEMHFLVSKSDTRPQIKKVCKLSIIAGLLASSSQIADSAITRSLFNTHPCNSFSHFVKRSGGLITG